jgi:hypothetical protein
VGKSKKQDKELVCTARQTITLAEERWAAIDKYRRAHGLGSKTAAIDRLIAAGLTVKVVTAAKTAKRKSI